MNQALIIIDAQQGLIDGSFEAAGVFEREKLIQNINFVIEKAIEADASAEGEGEGFQIHKDIKIPSNATIFVKAATNSFYGTPLNAFLEEHNIEHLVMMGCKTEYCIDTAVRAATVHH